MSLLLVIRNTPVLGSPVWDAGDSQHVIWLLDSLLSLFELRSQWPQDVKINAVDFIDFSLEVLVAHANASDFNAIIYQKLNSLLVLFCAGVAGHPKDILGDVENVVKARRRLCVAFIQLAKASIKHKPISRLIKGQLLPHLKDLTKEHLSFGPGTDFWVNSLPTICVVKYIKLMSASFRSSY